MEAAVTFSYIDRETVQGWLHDRLLQTRCGDIGSPETAILIIDTDDGICVGYHGTANGTRLLQLVDHARARIKRKVCK